MTGRRLDRWQLTSSGPLADHRWRWRVAGQDGGCSEADRDSQGGNNDRYSDQRHAASLRSLFARPPFLAPTGSLEDRPGCTGGATGMAAAAIRGPASLGYRVSPVPTTRGPHCAGCAGAPTFLTGANGRGRRPGVRSARHPPALSSEGDDRGLGSVHYDGRCVPRSPHAAAGLGPALRDGRTSHESPVSV